MFSERGNPAMVWTNAVDQENPEYSWTRIMRAQVLEFNLDVPELQLLI